MKIDLLFSDLVAFLMGILGLVAAVVALQNALAGMLMGSAASATVFGLIALSFFLPARRFFVGRSYDAMLESAAAWQRRIPFIVLHSVWLFLVTFFLLGMKPEDFFGVSVFAPWLFSPVAVLPVLVLFAIVFVLPGLAFRPYRTPPPGTLQADGAEKRGILTVIRQNSQAIMVDSHPVTEGICKIADVFASLFVVACFAGFLLSNTHASLQYLEEARPILYPITFLIFLILYLPKNFGLRIVPATGEILFNAKRKLINAVFLLAASYGLAHIPYYYMIPAAYNQLIASQEAEITYKIDGIVNYAGCPSGLSLAYSADSSRSFHVCSVDPVLQASVTEGDSVIVRGKISYYGHSAESLRLPR